MIKTAFDLATRHWPLVALLVSAAMLATAHIFENLGYAPCTLCLRAREVYWTIIVIAALALVFTRTKGGARAAWAFDALLAAAFFYGTALAIFHSGVEWKWWPGPESCAATGAGATAAGLDALLRGAEIKPPACDEPNWWFLGLTMANWNVLVSLFLANLGAFAAARRRWAQ